MIGAIWNRVRREAVVRASSFLPAETRRRVERHARGREEVRMLQQADCVVVSHGKSGRTWLRVMLSRFYQVRYGLPQQALLIFDNLHRRNSAIPKIFFTHDNYIRDFTGNTDSKADFSGKKVVLLIRHPADVAVSQYFQWRFRMAAGKKALNGYPPHGAERSVYQFVMQEQAGLARTVGFLNEWARDPQLAKSFVVRYEDLHARPEAVMRGVLEYLGEKPTNEEVAEAVAFASVEHMRKLETRKVFWLSGSRLLPGNRNNPDSYKVRRAKVGGYRDYFDDAEVHEIDAYVKANLSDVFGYAAAEPAAGAAKVASDG